jgi:hypothetical protein
MLSIDSVRTGVRMQHAIDGQIWNKSASGRVKCNIDASFSPSLNRVCISICIRNEVGAYVLGKYVLFSPISDVHVGLSALK